MRSSCDKLAAALARADAVLVGIGAGMSASAGFSYSGRRFLDNFGDFHEKYGIEDMYSGGFYDFSSLEEFWAWWSRMIILNRYDCPVGKPYTDLIRLLEGRDFFILTTNVDHQLQRAGVDKTRLFYTQGDYGLFQCSLPCHRKTYDNEAQVRAMAASESHMRIDSSLIPRCPVCGRSMAMNLRSDGTFVEDDGWHIASGRYRSWLEPRMKSRLLLLELGVGGNTPGIIKYPFWQMTAQNPQAVYACINAWEAWVPGEIADRSLCISADIGDVLEKL